MAALISLLLKLLPLLLSLFGLGHAMASHQVLTAGGVGVVDANYLQYVGGWSAVGAAGWGLGEWLRAIGTRALNGGLDIAKLTALVQLILRLMTIVKGDAEVTRLLEMLLGFKVSAIPEDEQSLVRLLLRK